MMLNFTILQRGATEPEAEFDSDSNLKKKEIFEHFEFLIFYTAKCGGQ